MLGFVFSLSIQAVANENPISITLNHSVKDVDEGSRFSLTATAPSGSTGTITWTTSKSSIATVDSLGYVTGKQAGTAVITATYIDSSGATASACCTVYVTVADGLYYIKNASSNLCLYTGGSSVSIQSQVTSADGRLGQFWKITYVSNGRYEIQPIHDTSVALTFDSSNYVTIGETDTAACWGILHNSFGYAIQYFGSNSENAKPVVASQPGSKVYLGDWETSLTCHWELEKTYGIFLRNMETKETVDTSTEMILGVGRTRSLADLGISYEYYGSMLGGITWRSDNFNIASVDSYGNLTGVNPGEARITVSATLNGSSYSCTFGVKIASNVLVLSNSPEGWMSSSQTMGSNMASAVGADSSNVQAVNSAIFADIWNNVTSDHIIIHTHGSPNGLFGEDFSFLTQNISQLQRNTAIGYVLITACSTGGDNGGNANIAALLSQYIAQDGIVVCCTTVVEGADTHFTATNSGQWIAYCNGQQIPCNLPTTITMETVADFWEGFK